MYARTPPAACSRSTKQRSGSKRFPAMSSSSSHAGAASPGKRQPGDEDKKHARKKAKKEVNAEESGDDGDLRFTMEPFDCGKSLAAILRTAGLDVARGVAPLAVESHCAGVDAPVLGLTAMGVPTRVVVVSEIDPAPALAHLLHHQPEHMVPNIAYGKRCQGPCLKHGGKWCSWQSAPRRDVLLASFVCTRYSTQNPARHSKAYDPIQEPGQSNAADTFFEVRHIIKETQPRFFVLENVDGITRTRGKGKGTPLDFMLHDETFGLLALDYTVEVVSDCRGTRTHLPQRRARTIFLGAHHSEKTSAVTLKKTFKALLKISGKGPVHHIDSFLRNAVSADAGASDIGGKSDVEHIQDEIDYHQALKKALQDAHNHEVWPDGGKLPALSARPSQGVSAPPGVRARIDVMSVVLGKSLGEGKHPLADVSQSMDRLPWCTDGTVPTLTTNSMIFSFKLGKFIHPKVLARSMGLPDSLNMSFLTVSQQRKIVGNGYIVPLAAMAVAAVCKDLPPAVAAAASASTSAGGSQRQPPAEAAAASSSRPAASISQPASSHQRPAAASRSSQLPGDRAHRGDG